MTFTFIYFFVSFILWRYMCILFICCSFRQMIQQLFANNIKVPYSWSPMRQTIAFFLWKHFMYLFYFVFFVVYESLSAEVQMKWNKLIIILFTIPFRIRKSFVCINIICYLYLLFSVFNSFFFSYNFWFFGWSSSHFLQMILKFSDGKCIK